jgi:hypothetical protein
MHFRVVDTETVYRRLLAAPDPQARATIFAAELEAPFSGMTQAMGARRLSAGALRLAARASSPTRSSRASARTPGAVNLAALALMALQARCSHRSDILFYRVLHPCTISRGLALKVPV